MTQQHTHNHEDEVLREVFADIDDGFYIDVGACMPMHYSNTFELYQKGWSGLIVEPLLVLAPLLAQNWRDIRPRDQLVFGMAADRRGKRPFYLANHAQMSTGAIDRWRAHETAQIGEPTAQIMCYPLNELLSDHQKPIHLLKVDVEGMEDDVMAGIDLQHWRPWVIIIEAVIAGTWDPHISDTRSKIEAFDYKRVYNDKINDWYVSHETADRWRLPCHALA